MNNYGKGLMLTRYGITSFVISVFGGLWATTAHMLNFLNKVCFNHRPRPVSLLDGLLDGCSELIYLAISYPFASTLRLYKNYFNLYRKKRRHHYSLYVTYALFVIALTLGCMLILALRCLG